MKKTALFSLMIAGVAMAGAQTKNMVIEYSNGTSEKKAVTEISKIYFETEGSEDPGTKPGGDEVDPTGKMVDLGLPSGLKWAAWNVGATKPEEYGNYYAYGEVEPKNDYTFDNYKWIVDDWADEELGEWALYYKLGANISGTNYDVAHVKWGDKWRMPSTDEWQELYNYCDKSWENYNGVTGARFTSKVNGNSIFIPAAGNKFNGQFDHEGTDCLYWSPEEPDTFNPDDPSQECRNYRIDISSTYSNTDGYDYPFVGFPIRPVYGDLPAEKLPVISKIPTAAEAVDLGLPSGTKWAPYNVGATNQNEQGYYFCYGEVTTKLYSHTFNYKYYDPLTDKYVPVGDGNIQATEYDPAYRLWGEDWAMPTKEQLQELIDECDWRGTANGTKVTGPNGNSIFLPVCDQMTYMGVMYYGDVVIPSSTISNWNTGMQWGLAANRTGSVVGQPVMRSWMAVEGGHAVRPVLNK